jgi:photosystem II stability/assembly factor-like uncharacterized protein
MLHKTQFLLALMIATAIWSRSHEVCFADPPPDLHPDLRLGYDGAFFTNMTRGYVFGDNAILATEDGGSSWRLVRQGGGIESLFFLDAQTFWILYRGGELHRTADGGRTFIVKDQRLLNHATGRQLGLCGQLFFNTPTDGWTICARSLVKTSDGGQTWTPTLLPREIYDSYQIYRFTSQEAIGVEQAHSLIHTTDGGGTWTAVPNAPQLRQLSCVPTGFCAALRGYDVYASTDRGQTWQNLQIPLQLPDRDEIDGVQAVAPALIVAVGTDFGFSAQQDIGPYIGSGTPIPTHPIPPRGIVLRWDGSTWTRFTHNEPQHFSGAYFVDAQHGWLTGVRENLIYKTTDGGQTLQFVPDYFRQIAALTPSPTPLVLPTPTP